MALTMAEVARDYETDGVPSSGPHKIKKSNLRNWGAWVEGIISAFTSNGGLIYSSLTSLNADLAHGANSMAWVFGDATVANNGIYKKNGASGTGSWTRVADLPFSFIIASDAGAGTANAIQATTSIPVSGSALVWMNIFETNTASPITVSFNGGSALTIKTNAGNNPAVGGLVAGMIVMGIVSGSTFRLISDQASSAIVAAAEAAQAAAEDAAVAAQASANAGFVFDTEADFVNTNIPFVLQFVETAGYYSPGDGGGHRKKRISTPFPVEVWHKQSADGAWWELSEPNVRAEMYGKTTRTVQELTARMAAGETVKIACYGDSTTDGNQTTGWTQNPTSSGVPVGGDHNAEAPNTWPVKLQALLRDMYANNNVAVFNAGYASQRMDNGWATNNYEAAVINNSAYGAVDLTFIAFGLNDLRSGLNVITPHIQQTRRTIEKVLAYGGVPVLLTCDSNWRSPFRADDIDFVRATREINAAKKGLAAELGIECWDIGEAMQRWFALNNDGEQVGVIQSDALHVGDRGHAFKASFVAANLFHDIARVENGKTTRILPGDPKGKALVGSGSFTFATGVRGQMNPLANAGVYAPGQKGIEAWFWNEAPDASLVYRNVSNGGQTDRTKVSMIRVKEWIGGTDLFYGKNPAEGGGSANPYRNTDRPNVITQLPYGLTKCTLEAPSSGALWYYGYFEAIPGCLAGVGRARFVQKAALVNALKNTGEIYWQATASSGLTLFTQEEAPDLSNVVSFGLDNQTIALLLNCQIEPGMGLCLLAGRGYETDVGYQRRVGYMLYRDNTTTVTLRAYRIKSDGTVAVSSAIATAADSRTGLQRYRINFGRNGGTGVQQIVCFDNWAGGTTLFSYDVAAGTEVPSAGYVGDVLSQSSAHGAGSRLVHIQAASILYL